MPAQRKELFNEIAELYDSIRPGYSDEIIETIVVFSRIPPAGRILEIGCGTGQITLPFARRGYAILGLEPGDNLAAMTRRKCRCYPQVEIQQITYENWPLQPQAFHLILSAQAFHWIDPELGCAKAAAALGSGGAFALVWNNDVSQDTPFRRATEPLYEKYFQKKGTDDQQSTLQRHSDRDKEILSRSDQFTEIREFRQAWEKTFPGADYIRLLHTHSDHRALPEPERSSFFRDLEAIIDRFEGRVFRKYETYVLLARRT